MSPGDFHIGRWFEEKISINFEFAVNVVTFSSKLYKFYLIWKMLLSEFNKMWWNKLILYKNPAGSFGQKPASPGAAKYYWGLLWRHLVMTSFLLLTSLASLGAYLASLSENHVVDPLMVQIECWYFLTFPKYILGPL